MVFGDRSYDRNGGTSKSRTHRKGTSAHSTGHSIDLEPSERGLLADFLLKDESTLCVSYAARSFAASVLVSYWWEVQRDGELTVGFLTMRTRASIVPVSSSI
ncbi:hypothetical protein Y032_0015g2649 [Ancylostoma ceylanicum]|uniref:Uncharacterized protein n=1 Tax=Ancylostoma ceylanicum TaxID=53326 RepID=A0A016V7M5_9BILA|nr:hypothetical protein Y032_0015g2649 [Ancylostoma ceylanicum]